MLFESISLCYFFLFQFLADSRWSRGVLSWINSLHYLFTIFFSSTTYILHSHHTVFTGIRSFPSVTRLFRLHVSSFSESTVVRPDSDESTSYISLTPPTSKLTNLDALVALWSTSDHIVVPTSSFVVYSQVTKQLCLFNVLLICFWNPLHRRFIFSSIKAFIKSVISHLLGN